MPGVSPYPPDKRQGALRLFRELGSVTEAAKRAGVPRTTLSGWVEADLARTAIEAKQALVSFRNIYTEHVKRKFDRDIRVCIFADQHFGHYGVDYELADAVARHVADDPDGYAILAGDLYENTPGDFPNKTTPQDQVVFPEEQKILVFDSVETLGTDKVLAIQDGNHDFRDGKRGFPTIAKELRQRGYTTAMNFVLLTLSVGKQIYRGESWHALPGCTRLNEFNGHTRRHQDATDALHFVSSAHWHRPAIKVSNPGGVVRADSICGTFKLKDPFLWGHGKDFQFGIPVYTFHADRHQIDLKILWRGDFT